MRTLAAEQPQDFHLALVARRQRNLPRLGGQYLCPRLAGQQYRRAQPGARPHHQRRPRRHGRGGFDDRPRLVGVDELGGVGHRFEIVDHRQPLDAEAVADVADRHRPRQVLVDDRVVEHVARAGHRALAQLSAHRCVRRICQLLHEVLQHRGEAGPVGAAVAVVVQHADRALAAGVAARRARCAHACHPRRPPETADRAACRQAGPTSTLR